MGRAWTRVEVRVLLHIYKVAGAKRKAEGDPVA